MKTAQALPWSEEPYRELDFYTAADEALFRERCRDAEECFHLFTQYHTKVLLLHGSSGSGKSSFLRAALIPRLKRVTEPPGYAFLPDQDGVIRCTDDPVRVLARQVLAATETSGSDTIRQSRPVCQLRETAPLLSKDDLASTPSASLVEPLLNSLSLLRLLVARTLVLVVDQAEEILTHPRSNGCTDAFFRFVEEIYLRDFDVRLIVSLRTEYYGRFRNQLQIRDCYRALPADNGLELYLLKLLRDPEVLTCALDWPASNEHHDYGFRFAPGALRMIVDDVLGIIPENGSVTPALQVVCATLTRQRSLDKPVTVTAEQYWALGGFGQIMDRFINSAITTATVRYSHPLRSALAAIGIGDSLTDRWRGVLTKMVSEQGGGVVVAIPGTEADLEHAARSRGLTESIGPALRSMASGRGAILRLMGTEANPTFILKHDSLALRLARWNQQQAGARRTRRKAMYAAFAGAAICVMAGTAFLIASHSDLLAHDTNIRLRNNIAEHEPGGHAERSLMVLLADMDETRGPYNFADRLSPSHAHHDSVAALRRTLLRAPWFHGRFAAAGMSSDGTELALLNTNRNAAQVLTFPEGADQTPRYRAGPWQKLNPPDGTAPAMGQRPRSRMFAQTAVGFVTGLDVTVVRDGQAIYWNDGATITRLLAPMLPGFEGNQFLRYDIVGGAIQATQRAQRDGGWTIRSARLDGAALSSGATVQLSPAFDPSGPAFQQPGPLFDNASTQGRYLLAQSSGGDIAPESESEKRSRAEPCPLDLWVRHADGSEVTHFSVSGLAAIRQDTNRPQLTMAFAIGDASAVAFKSSGLSFYLRDWSPSAAMVGLPTDRMRRITASGDAVGTEQDNRLVPAQWQMIHPLFAVARIEHGWRAAWMVGNGIQAVETDANFDKGAGQDATAHEILTDVLISEPAGIRLEFSKGGNFLVLEQNAPDWSEIDVKIWDLGSAWRSMIERETTDETELTKVACRVISESGTSVDDQLKLFDIAPQFATSCEGAG